MPSDCDTVADLWNAKRLDSASCWFEADAVDEAYVSQLLSAGVAISIAREDESPVGFGLWFGSSGAARLVALAADEDEIYYRLLLEFCDWGIALEAPSAYAEIGTAMTTERGRMDALGVIQLVAIGFEPLEAGQDPANRVPKLLRAECDPQVLKDAVTQILEPTP
jgi:hypothetical protein